MANSASSASGEGESLFDAVASGTDAGAPDRVRELKRLLFDLAYLVVNADGTEHISERMLIQKLERRMEREGSVDVEARTDELRSVLEEGEDAIQARVLERADRVADLAGDRAAEVGDRYLDLLRGLIVADANVASEEHALFEALCERWGVEKTLPR